MLSILRGADAVSSQSSWNVRPPALFVTINTYTSLLLLIRGKDSLQFCHWWLGHRKGTWPVESWVLHCGLSVTLH